MNLRKSSCATSSPLGESRAGASSPVDPSEWMLFIGSATLEQKYGGLTIGLALWSCPAGIQNYSPPLRGGRHRLSRFSSNCTIQVIASDSAANTIRPENTTST